MPLPAHPSRCNAPYAVASLEPVEGAGRGQRVEHPAVLLHAGERSNVSLDPRVSRNELDKHVRHGVCRHTGLGNNGRDPGDLLRGEADEHVAVIPGRACVMARARELDVATILRPAEAHQHCGDLMLLEQGLQGRIASPGVAQRSAAAV